MLEKKCALLRTLLLNSADWGGFLVWARPLLFLRDAPERARPLLFMRDAPDFQWRGLFLS